MIITTGNKRIDGIAILLGIIFIVLKLTKVISWSWLWVTSPLWIWVGIIALILLIAMIFFPEYVSFDRKW